MIVVARSTRRRAIASRGPIAWVHNGVDGRFEFLDGLIVHAEDTSSFAAWARPALGLPSLLFGWIPGLRTKVRRLAAGQLDRYQRCQ